MMTRLKTTMLALLTLVGAGFSSCQKEMIASPTTNEAEQIRNEYSKSDAIAVDEQLLQKMVADKNVRLLFLDSYNFAAEYENAIRNMPAAARKNYFASQQNLNRLSPGTDYLVRTPAQMTEFYASHAKHAAEVSSLFPAYDKMGDSEHAAFTAKLVRLIVEGEVSGIVGAGAPCSSGYSACMGSCGSASGGCADGCWAGLKACLNVSYQAR